MKVGDLVQFKSGGPCMTVLDVKATIKCGWFTEGRYYDAHFPDECLMPWITVNYTYVFRGPDITSLQNTTYPDFLGSSGA